MDITSSLFEHIRNRLPPGYGFGDDNKVVNEQLIPNHQTSQQSIREDHEGDVGVFELTTLQQPKYSGYTCLISEVQIVVVTKNGDIEEAKKYLMNAFNNIKDIHKSQSTAIWVKLAKLVNLIPLGKNSKGLQMVEMTLSIKYLYDGAE